MSTAALGFPALEQRNRWICGTEKVPPVSVEPPPPPVSPAKARGTNFISARSEISSGTSRPCEGWANSTSEEAITVTARKAFRMASPSHLTRPRNFSSPSHSDGLPRRGASRTYPEATQDTMLDEQTSAKGRLAAAPDLPYALAEQHRIGDSAWVW